MKLLIVAYEFPPSPSPQSLRWAYLGAEMAKLGHEVHVLSPELSYGALDAAFDFGDGVTVHRTYPGPVKRFISRRLQIRHGRAALAGEAAVPASPGDPRTRLNWKGRALARFDRIVSFCVFPDQRALWNFWARSELDALLERLRPDAVIASHEPASTLQLGLRARREGHPWVADLGDPVLAPYTPRRWRRKAFRVERETIRQADAVVVTSERTLETMVERHGADRARLSVVPQGCPERSRRAPGEVRGNTLELVYTGAFYPFRPIEPLLEAVVACAGVRLRIASARPPEVAVRLAEAHPDKLVLCGHLPHDASLALQDQADVLVSVGNLLPAQIPGKLYEYLSSGKPIMHLRGMEEDAGAELVETLRRGWVGANRADQAASLLNELVARKRSGTLAQGLDLSDEAIGAYRWSALAERYLATIERAVRPVSP